MAQFKNMFYLLSFFSSQHKAILQIPKKRKSEVVQITIYDDIISRQWHAMKAGWNVLLHMDLNSWEVKVVTELNWKVTLWGG